MDVLSLAKELEAEGIASFDEEQIQHFKESVADILRRAEERNEKDDSRYFADDTRRLINRIREYFDNYFAWLWDTSLPTTNNLSERALRCVKSHLKLSGQFESVAYAEYYALIKTYVETCRKNGINEVEALVRLEMGNPYTVSEIFGIYDEQTELQK